MKLIVKEFLSQLRESGELDRLLPDLLSRMKIVPISRPQIGVRQNGVDVAAVGRDKDGVKALFLFVLKVGDLGRRDWDGGLNAVRATLNQVKDSYLHSFVRPEHRSLPVRIVVCSTGELKQDVTQDYNGYVVDNQTERVSYEFWSGDDLAALIEKHLLDEYAIDPSERADLRRGIALIGSRDYDLRHVYKLLDALLLGSHDGSVRTTTAHRKKFIRKLRTAALVLEIIFRWANEEGNLLNAFKLGERCCLWAWEFIRVRELFKYRPAMASFWDIYQIHDRICRTYYDKVGPYFMARDGISVYAGENALVTCKVFEQIGVLAEIGLVQLQNSSGGGGEVAAANADAIAKVLVSLVKNNPSSGSPRYDENAIDLSMAFMLLFGTGNSEAAKAWLDELANRVSYCLRTSKCFPVSTDSFDDLVALEIGELTEEEVGKLKDLSTLVPTLMYWSVVFEHDALYRKLQNIQGSAFDGICLQLWYADEATESFVYRESAQYESGTTEAPIVFPADVDELIEGEKKKLDSKAIVGLDTFSAVRYGMFVMVMMACRHYRTPFPPQFWMSFIVARLGVPASDQNDTTS
ncbi:hypothetical protein GCM10027285_23210 [Oleiagrimonas citrea]|uniref:Chemotaxis protein n=1 Tax=Oleiagrimonas citrea TaxID=1665687 RepID=A0A846ZE51_9GAMM|nr:hypothetical protein [Oleiagrimonas citrea]NKZ37366.1 hypothetical protein [Oleiagrimonas citrea]